MKKIMFSDKYGLTDAVLEGRKTMTRRIVPDGTPLGNWSETVKHSKYQQGEEVAIAQKYRDLCNCDAFYKALHKTDPTFPLECIKDEMGCDNKMYVKAEYMPHRILITNVKLERLQDISEEDAIREGVFKYDKPPRHHECDMFAPWPPYINPYKYDANNLIYTCNARYAFAYLIDRISGRGTWRKNPYVFAYEFLLIR